MRRGRRRSETDRLRRGVPSGGAVLDNFFHYPDRVPARRLNQSTPEIVCISSEGLDLHCEDKNSLSGRLDPKKERGAQQATVSPRASPRSSENARRELFPRHYQGV